MAERNSFALALRQARVAEAAQLEAIMNIRDARALRLESLRDAVQAKLDGNPQALELFDLAVQPGARPKLWVDLVSSVVMEPDPRSYRLVQDREKGSETVFESVSESEMADYLVRYLAHRIIAHDRLMVRDEVLQSKVLSRYSLGDMIYVWVTGCMFGVMTFLTAAMYLGMLHF